MRILQRIFFVKNSLKDTSTSEIFNLKDKVRQADKRSTSVDNYISRERERFDDAIHLFI